MLAAAGLEPCGVDTSPMAGVCRGLLSQIETIGIFVRTVAKLSGSLASHSLKAGVYANGMIVFTRIPSAAHSTAAARLKVCNAALTAAYTANPGPRPAEPSLSVSDWLRGWRVD